MRLSLRKNFYWTFAGNAIYACCQWGLLIILAKLGSPEMVGKFALGLAITAPVFMFTNLQLRGIQATDAKLEFQFFEYFVLRIASVFLAIFTLIIIISMAGYRGQTLIVIILIGVGKASESISDIIFGLIQLNEKMIYISRSMITKGVLSIVSLGGTLYVSHDLIISVFVLILFWVVVLIGHDVLAGSRLLSLSFKGFFAQALHQIKKLIKGNEFPTKLLLMALPMGIVMMLVSLNVNLPRYFIQYFLGEGALGIFAALAYLLTAGITIVAALGQSASPRLAKLYSVQNYKKFRNLINKLVIVGCFLGLFGVVFSVFFGEKFLVVMYGESYARHSDLFLMIMIAAGFSYISAFLGFVITAARKFKVQLPLFLVVTTITCVVSFCFVDLYGLRGAGYSLIVSSVVQLIGSSIVLWRILADLKNLCVVKGVGDV